MKNVLLVTLSALFFAGCVGTDLINESPVEPEDGYIVINAGKQAIQINETISLTAVTYDASDNPVTGVDVTWASSNSNVISIDATGNITGISIGQVTITASADGFTNGTTMISAFVDPNTIASIEVTPVQAELDVGNTVLLIAVARNGNGDPISNTEFEWSSSNTSVASVNSNGLVTALQSGSSVIYASSGGIRSSDIPITVRGNAKTGNFMGNPNTSYNLSGRAELIQNDGSLLLKFSQDFSSSNGPGLYVYLSRTQSIGSGSVELGELKSVRGAQEYTLNGGNINDFNYVIIHCTPFNVSFGWAELN